MTFWWWVLVFGGIAIMALALFAMLGLRLWRKAKVLLAELARLSALTATLEAAMAPADADEGSAWVPDPLPIGSHRSK